MMKIVVGTDFNDLATAALRLAGMMAARAGGELIVVYADSFEPPAEFTATQLPEIAASIEQSKRATREQLDRYVSKHVEQAVHRTLVVAEGLVASTLLSIAEREGADLIALGTHGRGGLDRLIMGSVAEAVIRKSHVPVLTVRSAEAKSAIRRVLAIGESSRAVARGFADVMEAELTVLLGEPPREDLIPLADEYDAVVLSASAGSAHALTRHARAPVVTVPDDRAA